jgi:hypothetical protein
MQHTTLDTSISKYYQHPQNRHDALKQKTALSFVTYHITSLMQLAKAELFVAKAKR